jgi:hypothetical protein
MTNAKCLSALILFLCFLVSTAQPADAATIECRPNSVGGQSPPGLLPYTTKAAARHAAIQNWIGVCSNVYLVGAWCDWVLATDKKVACNRVASGVGTYNHHCEVKAVPCRHKL